MPTRVDKVWGYEEVVHNSDTFALKILHFLQGAHLSWHFHKKKDEVWRVLSGSFTLTTSPGDDAPPVQQPFRPGDSFHVYPGLLHTLHCLEAGQIAEASTHDDPEDSFRLRPSLPPPPR